MNIFHTDQIDGEYDQGNDPQCQVYDLGFQAEHQKKKNQRNYKDQDKTGTDQLWIPFFEPVGTLDKISPSVFVLHHGFHHQCKLWAGELPGCSLSQHQVCFGKTFVEQMVQIHQKWSQYQSDEECKEKEKQQGQQRKNNVQDAKPVVFSAYSPGADVHKQEQADVQSSHTT